MSELHPQDQSAPRDRKKPSKLSRWWRRLRRRWNDAVKESARGSKDTQRKPSAWRSVSGVILTFIARTATVFLVVLLLSWSGLGARGTHRERLQRSSVTELLQRIDRGEVSEIYSVPEGDRTYLVEAIPRDVSGATKLYMFPELALSQLMSRCQEKEVLFTTSQPRYILLDHILSFIKVPLILLIVVVALALITRSAVGDLQGRRFQPETTNITFADVGGADEAKRTLMDIVSYLADPKKYSRLGAQIPKGVLLSGDPGNGKTLLARAVAGEAKVPFYQVVGSEFIMMFVGYGAKRIRELFKAARETGGIVFIDEFDAIGRARGSSGEGAGAEYDQTLNQILTELDGFSGETGVIVIAATNRPQILDPAVVRPGRFDRKIVVGKPDVAGRREILQATIRRRGVQVTPDIDLDSIALATQQFSGADIAQLVNLAAEHATRKSKDAVELHDFEDALDTMLEGQEGTLIIFDRLKRSTAQHEAGHAVCAYVVDEACQVRSVSVLRNHTSLGRVRRSPVREEDLYDLRRLMSELVVLVAGRAGEIFGQEEMAAATVGVEEDFKQASNLARRMVMMWGMGPRTGLTYFPVDPTRNINEQPLDAALAASIEADVRELLQLAFENAQAILLREQPFFERIVAALEAHNSLRLSDLKTLREPSPN